VQETVEILIRVERSQIAYLTAILESYEGLASIRTLDPAAGVVCIYFPSPLSFEFKKENPFGPR
jgi:hypothetical protein